MHISNEECIFSMMALLWVSLNFEVLKEGFVIHFSFF